MSGALSIALPDAAASECLGAALAPLCMAGDVITLTGGLGAGKTTLARGLITALAPGITEVTSPTYTLVQTYPAPAFIVWHFDLYRLERPGDLTELGFDDTDDGLTLIEWPDRAGPHLPAWRLDITLEPAGAGRIARLEPVGERWQKPLHGLRP